MADKQNLSDNKEKKSVLKEGVRASLITLISLGLAYGAVMNAVGAGKVYNTPMESSFEKTTRVSILCFSALFLAAMSGSVIDIGVAIRRQNQTRRKQNDGRA